MRPSEDNGPDGCEPCLLGQLSRGRIGLRLARFHRTPWELKRLCADRIAVHRPQVQPPSVSRHHDHPGTVPRPAQVRALAATRPGDDVVVKAPVTARVHEVRRANPLDWRTTGRVHTPPGRLARGDQTRSPYCAPPSVGTGRGGWAAGRLSASIRS